MDIEQLNFLLPSRKEFLNHGGPRCGIVDPEPGMLQRLQMTNCEICREPFDHESRRPKLIVGHSQCVGHVFCMESLWDWFSNCGNRFGVPRTTNGVTATSRERTFEINGGIWK